MNLLTCHQALEGCFCEGRHQYCRQDGGHTRHCRVTTCGSIASQPCPSTCLLVDPLNPSSTIAQEASNGRPAASPLIDPGLPDLRHMGVGETSDSMYAHPSVYKWVSKQHSVFRGVVPRRHMGETLNSRLTLSHCAARGPDDAREVDI